MPDISDLLSLPEAPDNAGVFVPPPPLRLQFRHTTVGGVSNEQDNIMFPWYWTRLDHPALNGRPNAIVTVTTVGRLTVDESTRTASLRQNPHPVGVVYRELDSRWYIFNLGFEAMELQATFHIAIHEDQRPD